MKPMGKVLDVIGMFISALLCWIVINALVAVVFILINIGFGFVLGSRVYVVTI